MLFNSYYFVLYFLPLVLVGYYSLNHFGLYKMALAELLAVSIFFYAYNHVSYIFLLLASICGNWFFSYTINKCDSKWVKRIGRKIIPYVFTEEFIIYARNHFSWKKLRKLILGIGISFNVILIFYFKYYNFFIENVNQLLALDFPVKNILLPLGISFFTFQQISYLVDTYRGETKGYSFLEYATFLSFFPQLVAGPIVLHNEMIPQFRDMKRRSFDHSIFSHGIYIFAVGMFKKVMIADTFGRCVAWGWLRIDTLSSLELIIIMLSYTFQIYFDFSGYCDIATGIAKMFHLEIPMNFNSPYKAVSIIDFWKRWHITLTRFLRNYIYFPLGGNRRGQVRTYINIMVVFLVSGIWHGANWTFVLWGLIHGVAQILNRFFEKSWSHCPRFLQWICTFIFVNFTWLIFRADNVRQALSLMKRIVKMDSFTVSEGLIGSFVLPEIKAVMQYIIPVFNMNISYLLAYMAGALFICLYQENLYSKEFRPTVGRAVSSAFLLFWSVINFSGVSIFIYFNF